MYVVTDERAMRNMPAPPGADQNYPRVWGFYRLVIHAVYATTSTFKRHSNVLHGRGWTRPTRHMHLSLWKKAYNSCRLTKE